MKSTRSKPSGGFTLMETIIAIGVLAILLTSFMTVFGPAAQQLRRAISVQEADRLVVSLEKELTTVRPGSTGYNSGFDKAYQWLESASSSNTAIFLYQYRGNPGQLRQDGSMEPYLATTGRAGSDYIVQSMVRRRNDREFEKDLQAVEGPIYSVRLTQLVSNSTGGGELVKGTEGKIENPPDDTETDDGGSGGGLGSDGYNGAAIAFQAEFYLLPNRDPEFLKAGGRFDPASLKKPIFINNMAVRR